MSFKINAACGCFIGNGRGGNEDNFYFDGKHLPLVNSGLKEPMAFDTDNSDGILFAVFDGMGGECAGEEASLVATKAFGSEFEENRDIAISGRELLMRACDRANREVRALAHSRQMSTGTTVASVYLNRDTAVACNVGDSRIFMVRDSRMLMISEDHTDERIIKAMGLNKKPVLLQYIGMPDTGMVLDPYITKSEIMSGDIYVICSDGVTDCVSADEIYSAVCYFEPKFAASRILSRVNELNGMDNATVIVIKIV